MIMKSRDRSDHLAALERFFERIRQFRLRPHPKKCTFRVTYGKLLGYMVSERGIEANPYKIRAILDMLAPRTKRKIRDFLCRLQYISRFIARLIAIYLPIFRLLRKSQPTVWDDQCQRAFERTREYLLSSPVLVPPSPGRLLLLYLSVSDVALGCMLAQLDDSGKKPALVGRLMRWLVLLTEFDIHYVTQKSIKRNIVVDHLASLPVSDGRAIDDNFPYEDVAVMTSLSGWRISVHLAFSDRHPATNNIVEYEACILGLETTLELEIRQMEVFGDSNLGIDIIGKISPKSSSGHEFILVAIDYFIKWVETASYARFTSFGVANFIRSHIICRYGVLHELISDRGVHFTANVDTLLQRYGI
ncbi:hypothetical protein VitviT2T_028762 [Vitis vinifera]|uniref:Integrase catalytic domain-containing protein n=1 Tax=Vitis vinifera TaxID=29760 RepID=A0ABY9DU87_VITVI|nr:hypothetical protein VitviT2T_028762 [Vitis vinifera]